MQIEVTDYLGRLGISFSVKRHENPAFTSLDAARERRVRASQIVKTMIAEGEEGLIYVAMVPGDRTLRLERLRRVAQDHSITLATPARLGEHFNLTVGAISPFQFLEMGARFYMDSAVLREKIVDISSGSPGAGIELASDDLRRALGATICEIASGAKHS